MKKINKLNSVDDIIAEAFGVSTNKYIDIIDNLDTEASDYIIEKAMSGVFEDNKEDLDIAKKEFNSLL